jgi:hypothetical protein
MEKTKIEKIKKFAFEFFTIFIGIFAAFALDNWNENRKDKNTEIKILTEINNGLNQDVKDLKVNELGHKMGLRAVEYFYEIILNKHPETDSLKQHYFSLFRGFISIQNLSGFETLKSKGLEIIENDSLRTEILSLYENDYNILRKLEENYSEGQFFDHYSQSFDNSMGQNFIFENNGKLTGIKYPILLTEKEKKVLLIDLWKVRINRNFMLENYSEVKNKIIKLQQHLEKELIR